MSKNQKEVKKIQSVYLQNLEKINQGIKPDRKSWKAKEGDFTMQGPMEKLRHPPVPGKVATSSAHAHRISRDLTCSICLDLFKQPVSLPCDHTFCKGCIEGYWTGPRGPGQGSMGSCPQCRKVYSGQSYRPNRIVANIVESYCKGLGESSPAPCPPEAEVAEKVPAQVPRCSRHTEELKLYCEEDQELVCLVCGLSQDHRNHTMMCVQEAEKKYRVSFSCDTFIEDLNTFVLNTWMRKREVCSVTVLFVLLQGSLNSTMDSLKAELNTALQCDREAEEEVKKLKVDVLQSPAHVGNIHQWEHLHLSLELE